MGDDLRVFVTEGTVRVEDERALEQEQEQEQERAEAATTSAQPRSGAVLLGAGTIARAGDSGVLVQEKTLPEVEDNLGWLSGFVIFHESPLADAVAEFNRYNERQIVIRDPQVAAIPISGKFRSTNFEGFVRLLEDGFPIRARHEEGRIVLTATAP
jgi:transmembrane sensor